MADVPGLFQHTRHSCHVRVYASERRLRNLIHLIHVNRQSAREETGSRWAAEFVGVMARELDSTGAQRVEMWRMHGIIVKSDVVPAQVVTEQYDDVGRPGSCDDCRDGEYQYVSAHHDVHRYEFTVCRIRACVVEYLRYRVHPRQGAQANKRCSASRTWYSEGYLGTINGNTCMGI